MEYSVEHGILGETPGSESLAERAACQAGVLALARQARRSVDIFSHDLDAALYDHTDFIDALKQLAITSPRTRIRILLQDSAPAIKHGNRLVELARRLTSALDIRAVHPDLADHSEAFLIADVCGYLHRPYHTRYEATLSFHDPFRARELLNFFDEAWDHSLADSNLRRLHL